MASGRPRPFCSLFPFILFYTEEVSDLARQLETFLRRPPTLGRRVYLARGAVVVGDVTFGDFSSVWYNAVLRGDINRIVVGHHADIQDNAVVHLADEFPCLIGDFVTVGHSAIVHACTVGTRCWWGWVPPSWMVLKSAGKALSARTPWLPREPACHQVRWFWDPRRGCPGALRVGAAWHPGLGGEVRRQRRVCSVTTRRSRSGEQPCS